MNENGPGSTPRPASSRERSPRFDPDDLGWRLAALPVDRLHHVHGQGYRYRLGGFPEAPQADLEVFPQPGLVRYTSEGVHVAITDPGMSASFTRDGAVIFNAASETERRTLSVHKHGEMWLFVSNTLALSEHEREVERYLDERQPAKPRPRPAATTADNASDDERCACGASLDDGEGYDGQCGNCADRAERPSEQTAPWEQPAPSASVSANAHQPPSNNKVDLNPGERVVITGRAGRDPRLSETKGGVAVAKFPLAEHKTAAAGASQTEETLWHNVVGFRDRAADIMETVKNGGTYNVIGYRHEREGKDGKIEHEIYAASVRPPTKKNGSRVERWRKRGLG